MGPGIPGMGFQKRAWAVSSRGAVSVAEAFGRTVDKDGGYEYVDIGLYGCARVWCPTEVD
jgi:hypothetical protein